MPKSLGVLHCTIPSWIGARYIPFAVLRNNLYTGKIWKAPKNGGVDHKNKYVKRIRMFVSAVYQTQTFLF